MLCGLLCSQKRKALAYTQFCSHWIPLSEFSPHDCFYSVSCFTVWADMWCYFTTCAEILISCRIPSGFSWEPLMIKVLPDMSASFPNLIVFGNLLKVHFGWSSKLLMSILNNNASAWTDGMLYPLLAAKSLGSLVLQLLFNASYSVFFQFIFPQSLSVSALATILEIILMSRHITYANLLSSI